MEVVLDTSNSERAKKASKAILAKVTYGSHLYGTNHPKSDYDYKIVYLPELGDVLKGRKFTNFKIRYNADGSVIEGKEGDSPMPENGYEMEFIALQTLMADWLLGQTYAVEVVYGIAHGFSVDTDRNLAWLCSDLIEDWRSNSVAGMVGFAIKQTMDYVQRGSRMNETQFFLDCLKSVDGLLEENSKGKIRLDSKFKDGRPGTAYDHIMALVEASEYADSIKATVTENGQRNERSINYAGRFYVETTPMFEILRVTEKKLNDYGTRSQDAAKKTVDPKSLMHAVRVYQQVLELLEKGVLTFPRPNREQLLGIRNLTTPREEVVDLMRSLDLQVLEMVEKYPSRVDELKAAYEDFTVNTLCEFYKLPYEV